MKNKKIINIILSIAILVVYLAIYSGLGKLANLLPFTYKYVYLIQIIAYIIMTLFLLLILKLLKKTSILKFDKSKFIKGLFVGGFAVFFIFFCFQDEFNKGLASGNHFLPFI